MSGGHFDYQQWRIREIADSIERDIALALKPKPAKIHEDYWTIYEMDSFHSFHNYSGRVKFETYEKAEEYLLRNRNIEKATKEYSMVGLFSDGVLFQSKDKMMQNTPEGEKIPVLYSIQHCEYDHYPYDEEVLELTDESIETMKEAYKQLRIAEIYANRVDWMMSDDDSEETMQDRLGEELKAFEEEYKSKDWSLIEEEE